MLFDSEWIGKDGDNLVILKSGEYVYIVNTTENPENACYDLPGSLDADNLVLDVLAVIEGESNAYT